VRFHGYATAQMRSLPLRVATQGGFVIVYLHFGTAYQSDPEKSNSPRRVDCLTLEDRTDTLSQNVGKQLPTYTAK
jgi:hypothetical protein